MTRNILPSATIPGLDLECYFHENTYLFSLRGTARNYGLNHYRRVVEILETKRFKRLLDNGFSMVELYAETTSGVHIIKALDSKTYFNVGLYLTMFSKNKRAIKLIQSLAHTKLDDLAAQAFGHQVDSTSTFTKALNNADKLSQALREDREFAHNCSPEMIKASKMGVTEYVKAKFGHQFDIGEAISFGKMLATSYRLINEEAPMVSDGYDHHCIYTIGNSSFIDTVYEVWDKHKGSVTYPGQ